MNHNLVHRSFAGLAFVISLAVYLLTVQQSVPFWDCGEFTAAAVYQQVPHPPGAPLFLMLGKLFHDFIPFGDPAWRVNLVSVFASAFSVLLTYLIGVKLIRNLRKGKEETFSDALAMCGSSFVGALALTFSDTFWFNAVESEVYAASTVFVALIVWLIMIWNEKADEPGHERYILLIAYLIGLSTGVHLLSVLTVFGIALIMYFRKYEFAWKSFTIMGAIAVLIFFGIYPGIVKYFPALLGGDFPLFRTEAREYIINNSAAVTFMGIGLLAAAGWGLYAGMKKNKHLTALICSSFLLMIIGYSTYTQTLIRANSNPPMNENTPSDINKLVSYLGREQYGDAPFWPRRYQTEDYYVRNHQKYGEWTPFEMKVVTRSDGGRYSVPDYSNSQINTAGELAFLWKYQMWHMYFRYFLWNFVGRMSDTQDAPAAWFSKADHEVYNYETGYESHFPIRFFALPLFFGLAGLLFHFSRDKHMALSFLAMFLVLGVLAAIQQNQQEPQPRERDYFYVGSFLIWCLWIGLGTFSIIDSLSKEKINSAIAGVIIALSLVAVPVNMAAGGWFIHNRTGNHIPFDYAYNILQSLEKDAIVFTNGDNDTFPLWYIQDVAGVRRDVRVVNLSLGNTLWYVDQLKNLEPWGAKKIPLTFSDESLRVDEGDERALSPKVGEAELVEIPVRKEILAQYTNDQGLINQGMMRFNFVGSRVYQQRQGRTIYYFPVQDQLLLDIIRETKFERPLYFSSSVADPKVHCGLTDFFRMEGMAWRICPVPQAVDNVMYACDEERNDKILMNIIPGDKHTLTPEFGFKLRNLSDPSVYYDESNRRSVPNYRTAYTNYAMYLINKSNKPEKAIAVLDTMNKYISLEQFPVSYPQALQIAELYNRAGAKKRAEEIARQVIAKCKLLIERPDLKAVDRFAASPYYAPEIVIIDAYELLGEYDNAIMMLKNLPQEPSVKMRIDELEVSKVEKTGDTTAIIQKLETLISGYQQAGDQYSVEFARRLQRRLMQYKPVEATPLAVTPMPAGQ